jgi:peroxiredoxin
MKKIWTVAIATWLGLGSAWAGSADPWIGLQLGPGAHGGVAVIGTIDGSPASLAKLERGDEVMAVGATRVSQPIEVVHAVRTAGVGSTIALSVTDANGKSRTVPVTLVARPSDEALQHDMLVGRPAPDFDAKVVAGPKLGKLSSLKGQVVLIDFFATWCGPCVEGMPHVQKLHDELSKRGLKVMGVSAEAESTVAGAAARFKVRYPLVHDVEEQAISAAYHVYGLPTMVVIDRKGVVREVAVSNFGKAERAVRALLSETAER